MTISNETQLLNDLLTMNPYGTLQFYVVALIGTVLCFVTILGNLLVLVSYKIDRELQTINNYLLLSLAVADLFIGLISIPFMTYFVAVGSWDIGYVTCQVWLCMDYLMSNASVMNLLLISVDRYFSVTRPLTYRSSRTKGRALVMIVLTYVISALLWPPWIIGYPLMSEVPHEDGSCYVEFLATSPFLTITTAMCAFYIPVVIMVVLYYRIYKVAQKRRKVVVSVPKPTISHTATQRTSYNHSEQQEIRTIEKKLSDQNELKQKADNKAARTLFMILLAFVVTWLPYDVAVIVGVFRPDVIPGWLWSFVYALCYVNSTVNPFCYAMGNPR